MKWGLSVEDRFWAHVEKSDGCWLWTGDSDGKTIPKFRISKKPSIVTNIRRMAWELDNKQDIPPKKLIFSSCNNLICVNPQHLILSVASRYESGRRYRAAKREFVREHKIACGCLRCGYKKCAAALVFHHRDPNEKEFAVSRANRSFEKLKEEFTKCDVLCANCHAEVHDLVANSEPDKLVLDGQ